jgi:D-lactate dehydrogenase (cytochrome)
MVMLEAWEGLKHDRKSIETVIAALAAMLGNRLVTSQAVREQHGNTLTWIGNQPPDAVVFPQTTADVQQIVRLCAAERVPVIAFGAGTSLEGQVNAPRGGICIDFRDMNRLVAVHAEDLDCVVEPGITRKQLNEQLRDQGVFFPIDPGADASLGGMAATRCSGTNAVRYGTMKDNVLSLKVVLASGEVMPTARRAKKSSSGYDLTRLMVGSEGTLGIITELTLRLTGIPEAIASGICPFPSVEAACKATILIIQSASSCSTRCRCAPPTPIPSSRCRRRRCCSSSFTAPRRASPSNLCASARSRRNSAAVRSSGRRKPRSAPGSGRRGMTPTGRNAGCAPGLTRSPPTSACRSRGSPNA